MLAQHALLLHILIFVFWLGADLGTYYSSTYLTRPNISPSNRLMAAKILAGIDMAPRFAMIATLPTGLFLAATKGWIVFKSFEIITCFVVGAFWAWAAWQVHKTHGSKRIFVIIDYGIRIILLLALVALALVALWPAIKGSGQGILPIFIAAKFLCLAVAILLGLLIRRGLKPLGGAITSLSSNDTSVQAQGEVQIRGVIQSVRPFVFLIWVVLLIAAYLGVATPI